MSNDETYDKIVDYFTEDRISDRYDWINGLMKQYISHEQLDDIVRVSEKLLNHVIIDYFTDIYRLKEFQNIEKTNNTKIFAYLSYWLLRHKPIQLICDENEKYIFINEKFCAELIRTFLFDNPANIPILQQSTEDINVFVETLEYYFKYRDISPKAIELMLLAFAAGRGYQLSVDQMN